MRRLFDSALCTLLFLSLGLTQGSSLPSQSITGDIFTKGTNAEPAVLPSVLMVIRGPLTKDTELCATGAFAEDGLTLGTYQIAANAPGLYAARAIAGSADASSRVPVDMSACLGLDTTSLQLTRLKALDCALSRRARRHV